MLGFGWFDAGGVGGLFGFWCFGIGVADSGWVFADLSLDYYDFLSDVCGSMLIPLMFGVGIGDLVLLLLIPAWILLIWAWTHMMSCCILLIWGCFC